MQIHQLNNLTNKKRKRIGRGGCRGTTAGRGTKGQKARSGGNVDPLFEGGRSSLVARMKKKRGFSSPHAKKNVVRLDDLERFYDGGEAVTLESFVAKNLISRKDLKNGVKIVATGELSKNLSISEGILATTEARAAIEKAGGSIAAPAQRTEEKTETAA